MPKTGSKRPETGPMRFGDDWCGVFVRGDAAVLYAELAKVLIEFLSDGNNPANRHLLGLQKLMDSCNQSNSPDGHVPGEQDAGDILRGMEGKKNV